MKRNILLAFTLLFAASVDAQQVNIKESNIIEKDNQVTVSFAADITELSSNAKLTITPVMYSDSGTQALLPIVVVGRNRAISDKRTGESQGLSYKNNKTIPYVITVPYEDWMREVSLRMDTKVASCCDERALAAYDVLTSKLIHYDIQPNYSSEKAIREPTELEKYDSISEFLHPMADYASRHEIAKDVQEEGTLRVYFKQGSSTIDPLFSGNDKTLAEVSRMIELIRTDSTATLKKVVIQGLTSPEGAVDLNVRVAAKRAESLKNYLGDDIVNTKNVVEILPANEGWEGLDKLVRASDMQYKQEVLDVIVKYDISDVRKKRLMNLRGGRPYNYMLKNFFPQLRNAGYVQLYYESKPDPSVATLNRAIDQINDKQYAEALKNLSSLRGDARVNNLRGVALMMQDNYTEAETYLKTAVEQGSEEAVKNLKEMQTKQRINP